MSKFTDLIDAFEKAGFEYAGESTMYSRFIEWGEVAGFKGKWIHHEFGGEVFNPRDTRSCFAKVM
jgi:hypothetical protein